MTDDEKAEILEREAAESAEWMNAQVAEPDQKRDAGGAGPAAATAATPSASKAAAVPAPRLRSKDALVVADRGDLALPFEHQNADHTWRLAQQLAQSTLVPQHLRGSPANVFLVLMTGRELGLRPLQALATLHVIEGKVGMAAQLLVALVLRSGQAEYFMCRDSTDAEATYETRRVGWPEGKVRAVSFSMEDAKRAGLAGKHNWSRMPAVMLRWRAAAQLARDVYPDITLGFYTDDEMDEVAAAAPDSVRTSAAGTAGLKEILAARRAEP